MELGCGWSECPWGHKRDVWDADGVRYKACGQPRQYNKCEECGKGTWHKVRKKTEAEKEEIAVLWEASIYERNFFW